MRVLIKNATIIDPQGPHHQKKRDIFIENGIIQEIAVKLDKKTDKCIEGKQLCVSVGWMDLQANFNDPGLEQKEDLKSGAKAAANGGYTHVAISGATQPVLDNKAVVLSVMHTAKNLPVNISVIGALTEQMEGKNFTELYDLHQTGVIAFSDGHHPILNPDVLKRSLQYALPFKGKVMVFPYDTRLSHGGVMSEGPTSTQLGLKSSPAMAEEIMVARDLTIAKYCNSPIHFSQISTAASVALIKKAKAQGMDITCDVAIANLVWNEEVLESFDSNYKVMPYLRTEKDRKALIKGVNEGTIDCIVTNHQPQNIEEKHCEFDHAAYGQSSIETAYSLYNTYLSTHILPETFVQCVSHNPRKHFLNQVVTIDKGQKAELTIFSPSTTWDVTAKTLYSKSKNTPALGTTLKGKVIDIVV